MGERSEFTRRVIDVVRAIPAGKVAYYSQVAALAGQPLAARQVVRVLHSCSEPENLPWHRVVSKGGRIALRPGEGFEEQMGRLRAEGVAVSAGGQVDLSRFLWNPGRKRFSGW